MILYFTIKQPLPNYNASFFEKNCMKTMLLAFLLAVPALLYPQEKQLSRKEYIAMYSGIAMQEMKRSGIPASIKLAQGILESGSGNSKLAKKANNHFGIKCQSGWTGKTIKHDDDKRNECFRVYRHAEESYRDHSDFLVNGSRYASLFQLKPTDYKGWANGLRKAGYATNPKYASLLINIIEGEELHLFDQKVLKGETPPRKTATRPAPAPREKHARQARPARTPKGRMPQHAAPAPAKQPQSPQPIDIDSYTIESPIRQVMENNRCRYIIVRPGDTFYSIAKDYDLMEWQLYLFNDMQKGDILQAGQVLYLQSKKSAADRKYITHSVRAGETLHQISQQYAIKMSYLMKHNAMHSSQLQDGQVIKLRR
jgi:LysM repeat protein